MYVERPNFRGYMKILILDLLKEPKHGYGIMTELEERYGIKLSAGTVYPILASLRKNGLIEVAETGDREKKNYVVTEKGLRYLEEHEEELEEVKKRMHAYRTFLELGGDELKEAFRELFRSIEDLTDEQREELRGTFREFARRIRRILLEGE
nr:MULTISPECIES: PadR family transcriptional regulator [unclassified Thermococcus]